MKFKSIEIHNFGRFKGTHFFPTDTTDEKNVILVKAINDRGKTTLFNAVNFAMYGPKAKSLRKPIEEYISLQAAREGSGEMWVEIKFEHEGEEYKIHRIQKFYQTPAHETIQLNGSDTVTVWEGGSPKKLVSREEQQQWINHILPPDASQFFFFDGEEIKRYIEKQSGDNVKSSIEMVLGIKELLNAREDLGHLHNNDFEREYNKKLRAKASDLNAMKEVEDLAEEIRLLEQDIQSLQSSIDSANALVTKYDKELEKYSSIKDRVKERETAIQNLNQAMEKKKTALNEMTEARSYAGLLLLNPLLDIIWKTEENPPSYKVWESEVAKRLIKEHPETCVCDTHLDEKRYAVLQSKIIQVKPSKQTLLKRTVENLLIREQPVNKKNEFNRIMQELSQIQQEMDQWNDTITRLDSEIGNNREVGPVIQDINNRRKEAYTSIGSYQNDLEERVKTKAEKQKLLELKKRKLAKSINDQEVAQAQRLVEFSDKVRQAIELAIERFTKQRIGTIEKYSSDFFRKLTNNPQLYTGLELDDSYEIKVKHYDGTKLPTYRYSPSAGASQIVATALIAGLSKYTTREAPIVIDTPLGRLDHVHRENLIKLYSSLSKQVIILYQTRELTAEDIKLFEDSIASEWIIEEESNNPDLSRIRQERKHL